VGLVRNVRGFVENRSGNGLVSIEFNVEANRTVQFDVMDGLWRNLPRVLGGDRDLPARFMKHQACLALQHPKQPPHPGLGAVRAADSLRQRHLVEDGCHLVRRGS
jgi:hypothetical protein